MKNVFFPFNSILYSLLFLGVLIISYSCNNDIGVKPPPIEEVLSPVVFTPNIPVDVDPRLQEKLKKEGNFLGLNEAFNEYSWKALVAINWPRDKNGTALPKFSDSGDATWLGWKEAFQVYRADGRTPAPWGSPRTSTGLIDDAILKDHGARVALSSSTPTHPGNFNVANEVDQAFAGKLFDQNGNVVVYEVLMNKEEFDYVVADSLYNINGQIEFSKKTPNANFPKGNFEKDSLGAIEIKVAWKVLTESDHKDRYYQDEGYVINESTGRLEKKDFGMIGFHISQKTPTGKQWVWSTFEHIDNLDQNITEKDGKTVVVHPTLTDPECEICPINVDVSNGTSYSHNTGKHGNYWTVEGSNAQYFASSPTMKTQAKRMIDIPVRVQRINKKMQSYFKQQNSVWQYYQLIDTQFPLDQNVPPGPNQEKNYIVPESVTNKPGGNPNIALLTNISMETFFQRGNQSASNLMEDNPPSQITIFGTESCMGCHSSAGIYKLPIQSGKPSSGGQLSGDFSWLLGKAQWNKDLPKPTK